MTASAGGRVPRCFTLRRVNPFLGVVAVVRTASGRGLSFDGRDWHLQVAAHPPRGLWSGGGDDPGLRWFRFGVWSAEEGLGRVPLNPILDRDHMLAASEALVDAIADAAPGLPFPAAPELELWLLDAVAHRPLALLATAMDAGALKDLTTRDWSAGGRGERRFESPSLTARGLAGVDGAGTARHAERLEQAVYAAAGAQRRVQWYRRGTDGTGVPLDESGRPEVAGSRLEAAAFPRLTLRLDWPDRDEQALADDYIVSLSPYLLMLPDLDDRQRAALEEQASRDMLAVDALWRLYPRIIDRDLVKRARVEARLRRAHA